jgi:hypothetical protein
MDSFFDEAQTQNAIIDKQEAEAFVIQKEGA